MAFGALICGHSATAHASGSIDSIATRAAAAVAPATQSLLVVAAPLTADQPLPHGDELALRFALVLAGKLGGAAHAHPKVASLSVARAAAGHSAGLVFVTTQIEKGELRATVDVYPVVANGWDRLRAPAPAPRAHAFASASVDAEIRTFLPVVTLEQAQIHRAHHDETEVLAAACGDLDGDGGMEIALISRSRVAVGHLRGKVGEEKFVVAHVSDWSALAARVPTPLRDPLGAAVFRDQELFAGTSDRGGVELGPDLVTRAALRGIPVATSTKALCAHVDPASSAYSGELKSCSLVSDGAAPIVPPAARFDALAFAQVADKHGVSRDVITTRGGDGKLVVRLGAASRSFDEVGAQVAVGDLDQDGIPEIVTTRDAPDDAIQIWSYDGTQTRERRKIPAEAGVSALAICPPEAKGVPALVAVVGSEVWLVR
ncbi:MAG: hypothetical protein ABI461_02125 [Polyangiaceae bacterium]